MIRNYIVGLLSLCVLLIHHSSASAEEAADWTEKIKLGVEARVRNESNFNYDLDASMGDKDNFTLLRARLNATATPSENFRGFVQIQSSRIFGDSLLTGPPFGPGNTARGIGADDEDIALHQGYLDIIMSDFTFRAGRQELNFGDQRLVGALGWSNRARSFDGFSLIHETDADKATIFFHLVQRNPERTAFASNDPYFFGANVTLKEILSGLDVYVFGFVDRDAGRNVPAVQDGNLGFVTLGLRTKSMPKEGLGYDFEFAYQGGENDDVGIIAFAGHAALGFAFGGDLDPKVLLEYNIASGDDPTTRRDTAFKNLFPTNHNKYGYIDFMAWSNMHDLRGGVSAALIENLVLSLDYHYFLAYEKKGAVGFGRAALPVAAARTSGDFGQELDVKLAYKHDKYFKAEAGYSLFAPGDMFAPPADDLAHFLYFQLELAVN